MEQKVREGNPGGRKLPEPLRTAPGRLTRPPGLLAAAAELWDEIVPRLEQAGVLDKVDGPALAAMCILWERAITAGKVVESEGHFARGSMGQPVEHPSLATERASFALFLRYAEQYALTPVARARVAAVTSGRHAADALAAIIEAAPAALGAGSDDE